MGKINRTDKKVGFRTDRNFPVKSTSHEATIAHRGGYVGCFNKNPPDILRVIFLAPQSIFRI